MPKSIMYSEVLINELKCRCLIFIITCPNYVSSNIVKLGPLTWYMDVILGVG